MQGQTFGEQFAIDPAAKALETMNIQSQTEADAQVTGGFGSKEATVLPTIKIHQAPPLTMTGNGHGQGDKLARVNSDSASKKSVAAEEAAQKITSRTVSKQSK